MKIRLAVAADSGAITGLINEAYSIEEFFVDGPRIAEATALEQIREGLFFVAVPIEPEAGKSDIVGCILFQTGEGEAYFGLLAVSPASQGKGLGRELVSFVEQRAMALGNGRMTLRVVDLRAELPPWYEKQGYRVTGTEPFSDLSRQKRPCHFLLLEKALLPQD